MELPSQNLQHGTIQLEYKTDQNSTDTKSIFEKKNRSHNNNKENQGQMYGWDYMSLDLDCPFIDMTWESTS